MAVAERMDGHSLVPVLVVTLISRLAMVIAEAVDAMYGVQLFVSLTPHIMIAMVTIWVVL